MRRSTPTSDELGSDGHPAFGRDLDHELQRVRLPLSEAERDDLRDLGRDAAAAVETALRDWRPGETDREIAARVVAHTEQTGADAPCLLVGGDERLESFRHPVANGSRPQRVVMAVLVARRDGLHVALTRHAATAPDPTLERGLAACRAIHRGVLAECRPGARFGDALTALDAGYRDGGCRGRVARALPGRPDRLRPAGVRDRPVPVRPARGGTSRSTPAWRWRGIRACREEPRMRTPTWWAPTRVSWSRPPAAGRWWQTTGSCPGPQCWGWDR